MVPNKALHLTRAGLYCPAGDFYIDPWRKVPRAIITHAHSDHARWGMDKYLCADVGKAILRHRVGENADISCVAYGEPLHLGSARVSLHPAGHILGSAQVRVEVDGYVAVVSGDYKLGADITCDPYESLKCHLFVTETTFGLPIYRWPSVQHVREQILNWWRLNQETGRCSVLTGYSLGKSQRALALLDPDQGPIYCHSSIHTFNELYKLGGINLPYARLVSHAPSTQDWSKAIVLAPPSAIGTPWMNRFGEISAAFCSGWMALRSERKRSIMQNSFVLSDHCDWPGLISAVEATGAEEVWTTHGFAESVSRYLVEKGIHSIPLETKYQGEAAPSIQP